MDLIKIIGAGFVTALTAILLKSTKPELSFAVTVAGVVVILLFVFDMVKDSFVIFEEIEALSGIDDSLIRVLLKVVGVGYLAEFSAGILNDFGSHSVADKIVFGGKAAIFLLSLPIIRTLLKLIVSFLSLV